MSLLKVNQLTVMRGEDVALVDNVSLTLEAGEMLGLVGESGSGKTVTCRALMRLLPGAGLRITGGEVLLGWPGYLVPQRRANVGGARPGNRHDFPEPDQPSQSGDDHWRTDCRKSPPSLCGKPPSGAGGCAGLAAPGRYPGARRIGSIAIRTNFPAACASGR